MRAFALCLLAGCQGVLGIPDETSVLSFPVRVHVEGIVGATDSPPQAFLVDELSGERQTLTLTGDGDVEFPRGLVNGNSFEVTASARCQVTDGGSGVIDNGPKQVLVACDGVLTLGDWGFSAPLETKQVGTLYRTYGSVLLTQQTSISPIAHYSALQVTAESNRGLAPFAAVHDAEIIVTVRAPLGLFSLVPERSYVTRFDLSGPPAQFGYGKPSAVSDGARFGSAVDAFEQYVLVGQPERGNGRVVLYSRQGQTWREEVVIDGKTAASRFGASVAIGKNAFVVGAPGESTTYLYKRNDNGDWVEQAVLLAAGRAGTAVAIEKGQAPMYFLVGAPDQNVVYAYNLLGEAAGQLTAADSETGDEFGAAVAISEQHEAIVGAPGEDSANQIGVTDPNAYPEAGAAYTFAAVTGSQVATALLKAPFANAGDRFGSAVAIDALGEVYAVGAPLEDSGSATDASNNASNGAGAVYVWTPGSSTPKYVKAPNVDAGDGFGSTIAIRTAIGQQANLLVVGAPYEDGGQSGVDKPSDETAPDAGAVYLFGVDIGPTITTGPYLKPSNTGTGDQFGAALALTGESLIVGAPYEDSAATSWNGAQGDGAVDGDNGAVYAFR